MGSTTRDWEICGVQAVFLNVLGAIYLCLTAFPVRYGKSHMTLLSRSYCSSQAQRHQTWIAETGKVHHLANRWFRPLLRINVGKQSKRMSRASRR